MLQAPSVFRVRADLRDSSIRSLVLVREAGRLLVVEDVGQRKELHRLREELYIAAFSFACTMVATWIRRLLASLKVMVPYWPFHTTLNAAASMANT